MPFDHPVKITSYEVLWSEIALRAPQFEQPRDLLSLLRESVPSGCASAEIGCGASTLVMSHRSKTHHVYSTDTARIHAIATSGLLRHDTVEWIDQDEPDGIKPGTVLLVNEFMPGDWHTIATYRDWRLLRAV